MALLVVEGLMGSLQYLTEKTTFTTRLKHNPMNRIPWLRYAMNHIRRLKYRMVDAMVDAFS